ncbi:MAG: hypothetical protein HY739_13995 [Desulfobacterales bacterium]|nr:hypothetical protein [Desulfobacterales bacterium]
MNEDYEDLKHFENIQFSIVKFAFRVYTIALGAPIIALYAYMVTLGAEHIKVRAGLNPPVLIDNLLLIGAISGIVFAICALFNWLRILKRETKNWWSCNVILNAIPILALIAITCLCFIYRGELYR